MGWAKIGKASLDNKAVMWNELYFIQRGLGLLQYKIRESSKYARVKSKTYYLSLVIST